MQSNMMALNRQCTCYGVMLRQCDPCSLRPMVEPLILAAQSRLESVAVLAKIVKSASKASFVSSGCGSRKPLGQLPNRLKMIS